MLDKRYINRYGLLNAKKADIDAENAPLWTLEYLLLKEDDHLFNKLIEYIHNCHTKESGLYNQFPIVHGNKDDYMSPDQLIAFIAALKKKEEFHLVKSIYKYLYKHLFTYNNLKPGKIDFSRIMQPSAVLFSAVCAGHFYFRPLLFLVLIYSCYVKKNETSGRLKAWVMMNYGNMKITKYICNYIIKKQFGSWDNVLKEYFKEEDHPIRQLID